MQNTALAQQGLYMVCCGQDLTVLTIYLCLWLDLRRVLTEKPVASLCQASLRALWSLREGSVQTYVFL
jgi:hypothetical protein